MNTGGFMFDQIDVLFVAWLGFSAISLIYIHNRNKKEAVKVQAQNKMCEDFEKFLDGSQK